MHFAGLGYTVVGIDNDMRKRRFRQRCLLPTGIASPLSEH